MTCAALVLAAGSARRFGSDKLRAPFRGEPLLRHAIRAARAAPVERVIVVCAPGMDIGTWPAPGPPVERIELASPALSASLIAGTSALKAADAAFVFLGDMPLVPPGMAARLLALLPGHYAALPMVGDCPGHPVLLSAQALRDVQHLQGDSGAGRLLKGRGDVARLPCEDPGAIFDVDRVEDLGGPLR